MPHDGEWPVGAELDVLAEIGLCHAGELPDPDDASGSEGEGDAEQLNDVEHQARTTRLPDDPGQRRPQQADRHEQQARDPYVDAAFEIGRDDFRDPALRAGARHDAVVQRKDREEREVGDRIGGSVAVIGRRLAPAEEIHRRH